MTSRSVREDKEPIPIGRSADHGCFGCGDHNPKGLHLRFRASADGVEASFIPGTEHQGFENVVHGGIISAILDEAMAWATAQAGFWAVTGEMRVRFRHPLGVGELTQVAGRVGGCRGRIVTTTAELTRVDDLASIATAAATFVKVSSDVEARWRARNLLDPQIGDGNAQIATGRGDRTEPGD